MLIRATVERLLNLTIAASTPSLVVMLFYTPNVCQHEHDVLLPMLNSDV